MNKKIAITAAVFDCLHEGHVNLLETMGYHGKEVVVILHDDKSTFKNKKRFPVQKLQHRLENLYASGLADQVIPTFETNPGNDLKEALQGYDPKEVVYIRGDDWKDFPGREVIEELGIEIIFEKYTKGVSTTQIRKELQA